MIHLYNFIGSWQLFPEKGIYEKGDRPKSGIYRLENTDQKNKVTIHHNWITLENEGFSSQYAVLLDGSPHPFPDSSFADTVELKTVDSISFEVRFYKQEVAVLIVLHEIMPNGNLRLEQKKISAEGNTVINMEIYHRQLSVLPYSASVAGAVIKPTEEGIIRHKALTAMEEQTNMQLDQIRRQIELLALQAQEIHSRKELSMLIYNARLSFKPEIGQIYHLYEKADGSHMISLISPKEWGPSMPFKKHVAAVQLLADHTWREI